MRIKNPARCAIQHSAFWLTLSNSVESISCRSAVRAAPIWQLRPVFALNGTRVETEPGNGVTISVEDSALRMQDEAIKTARIFTTKGII